MKKYSTKIIEGKLMLISRDIQVGDKVYCSESKPTPWCKVEWIVDDSIGVTIEDSTNYSQDIFTPDLDKIFKVIGEISSDALSYVKKGDEFNENQIKPFDLVATPSIKGIRIKGPCGHFH